MSEVKQKLNFKYKIRIFISFYLNKMQKFKKMFYLLVDYAQ